MRFTADGGMVILRGAVLKRITPEGVEDTIIDNVTDYEQTLSDQFDLHLPDVSALWDKVWTRHQAWLKTQQ